MKEIYWRWYKHNRDDVNDEVVEIEAEFEIKIKSWATQQPKGLLLLIREQKLDK